MCFKNSLLCITAKLFKKISRPGTNIIMTPTSPISDIMEIILLLLMFRIFVEMFYNGKI